MFHPVGAQPPNVYWRRRLLVLGSTVIVLVLLAVTVSAVLSGGSGSPAGAGSPPTKQAAAGAPPSGTGHHPSSTPSHHPHRRTSSSSAPRPSGSSAPSTPSTSAAVETCRTSDLDVAAVTGRGSYHIGARPKVELQVTNVGPAPCVQDLADKQILLKVYNGVSRVWGSHDCEIQPGTNKHTLAVGAPVRVIINWSGETSQPQCKGTRQKVGAGTYTLYATLSGKTGKAAQFTIS